MLIKVPGTSAGIDAFEQLTAGGLRINVTLIFSLAQYEKVARAYLRGAQSWMDGGGDPKQLRSVASVFLSRVDTLVDQRLEALGTPTASALKGRAGVALARCCYGRYQAIFHGTEWAAASLIGVPPQWPLWASTGCKNPAYPDVLYVEALIGPESITTLPDVTLAAFREHGQAEPRLAIGANEAHLHIEALAALGIKFGEIGESLQIDGLQLFSSAYANIMHRILEMRT